MEQPEKEIFKVWPTFRDQMTYRAAMEASSLDKLRERFPKSFTKSGWLRQIGIDHPPALEAIWYFYEQIAEWIALDKGAQPTVRLEAVTTSLLRDLRLVSITLGDDDDAQVIFETLNGHGAELHATDLIRNFIFMRADREGNDAGELYNSLWSPFEGPFWFEEQRRGRLKRPRLEWFVQTAIQTELKEDVDIGRLYVGYRQFVLSKNPPIPASTQLQFLTDNSDNYRSLVTGLGDDPIGKFGRRIAAWDASTTHPLALFIANCKASNEDKTLMFDYIVSYLVRRAICGLTTKNYNKVFMQQLKRVDGEITANKLAGGLGSLEGEASRWPRNDELQQACLEKELYPGRLDPMRIKALLAEIETAMRSSKTEEPMPAGLENLDVEHVLPSSWFEHWQLSDGTVANYAEANEAKLAIFSEQRSIRTSAIIRREISKATLGNLTLLHYGVNRSLQNRAFSIKRERLFAESNLHLNRRLMRAEHWDEDQIELRGRELFEIAKQVWPRPEA